MKQLIRLTIVLMLLLKPGFTTAQPEFRYGLMGKLESNRLKIENADNKVETKSQPGLQSALGFYAAKTLGKTFFLDASLLFSRAKYTVNYARSGSVFMDADVRFTEVNMNLNLVLNPNSTGVNLFLFGGGQFLFRRWGEERFVNAVISNTYWPTTRIMAQGGIGAKCSIGNNWYLQPFAGFRYALEQQLVYDIPANQYYFGVVLCHGIKGKAKNRYNKCPTEF